MKRLLLLLALVGIGLSANTHQLNNKANKFEINLIDENQISINMHIGEVELDLINVNNQNFTRIRLDNNYYSNIIGSPELPQFNRLIEIPFESEINIEITEQEYIDIDLSENGYPDPIYPNQPSLSKSQDLNNVDFVMNESIYETNQFVNEEIINFVNKGIMRSVQIGNVMLLPFNYNPVTGTLRIYTDIKAKISFNNINTELNDRMKNLYYSPYFEPIYKSSLSNYITSNSREDDLIEDNVTYVIVANSIFRGYLDDFVEWKTRKGFHVIEAYTDEIGSSASAIKSYLAGLYNTPGIGVAPPSFVLLVGDTQQLPASYSSGGHVSDLDYCDFTNDNIPEILHGRFSANNPPQLITQIEKTLQYENYTMPDPSFLANVIMISGVDANYAPTYGNGQINYGNNYYFNSTHGITSNTFLYPASGSSGSQILNLANQGSAFMNYTAHGYEQGWADPAFDNNDVNSMSNNNKYPTMVGNCCLTNAFDSGTCFGEALLQKNGGGAIGYIGGSDVTYWNEDYWWGVGNGNITSNPNYLSTGQGAYDGIFHDQNEEHWAVVNTAIMFIGNLAVAEANGMDDYYWEIYHLMGDPSLSTYFGIPDQNNVTHDVLVPVGIDALEIQAEPFSYVGVTQNGNLLGSGTVAQDGFIVIVLDSAVNQPGMLDIVITAQNRQPYFGEILVASPEGAFVTVNNLNINYGTDNMITAGETIDITIELENLGNENSSEVGVSLSSNDEYVNIQNGYASVNQIEDGNVAEVNLSFSIDNNTPYGHSFTLDFEMTSEENNWTNSIDLSLEALVESFANGNLTNLDWELSGNAYWSIDSEEYYNNGYSARSGNIGNNTESSIEITMDVLQNGSISFYKRVSCEDIGAYTGNYYDYLAFYIDGVEKDRWAGEVNWSQNSYSVTEGEHTFKWTFIKDIDSSDNINSGEDAVWIDYITFPSVLSGSDSMMGDLNNDEILNVLDVILMVNIVLELESPTSGSDMNMDGNTNVLDVILLVNQILEN